MENAYCIPPRETRFVSYCIHRSLLFMLYKQLFLSTLTHGISPWGSATTGHLACLRISQKNAFRAVLGLDPRALVSSRLRSISLDVLRLFRYRLVLSLSLAIDPSYQHHSLCLTAPLSPPVGAISWISLFHFSTRSLSALCRIALTWNSLSPALKVITSYNSFKRTLRIYLHILT